jgi:hypothetical protein
VPPGSCDVAIVYLVSSIVAAIFVFSFYVHRCYHRLAKRFELELAAACLISVFVFFSLAVGIPGSNSASKSSQSPLGCSQNAGF